MRNLRAIALEEVRIPQGLPLTATAWDATDDSIICAFGPVTGNPIIELRRKVVSNAANTNENSALESHFKPITSWDAPCPLPNLECDEILLLQYFSDISTACLVLAGGDLVVVREDPLPGQEKIEIVGSVDIGIAAAAWAPNEELLAIVTRGDTLVLMSRDFEPITESSMTPDDLKASKHVSVGWGKKETQFQGKRAKALRDPTMPETVDQGTLSLYDDGRVCVSWRGDGAFIAINSIVSGNRRVIRVYTREAVLDSASEPVDGLESALSWRPAGNLIASIQRRDDHAEVVFFERNGLRHGEFALRLAKDELQSFGSVISMSWSIDSSVLAISFLDRVQLWTMGNYHYYLKQEIFGEGQTTPERQTHFKWHNEKPLRCSVLMSTSLLDVEYIMTVCRGSTEAPDDHGAVAVIDGHILKLTPFKHVTVPPPMAFCEVIAEANIIDCSISLTGRRVGILTKNGLEVHEWKFSYSEAGLPATKTKPLPMLSKISTFSMVDLFGAEPERRCTQLQFSGDGEVLILAPPQFENGALVRVVDIQANRILAMEDETSEIKSFPRDTRALVADICSKSVWCQSPLNTALATPRGSDPLPPLPSSYLQSAIFSSRSTASEAGHTQNGFHVQYHLISLTRRGDLLADERVLTRGCTSFLLTGSHVILTTAQHLLKFIHLDTPDKMEVPGDTPEVDERCRSIERGAKLVTAAPSAYSVVLQMPRGNLETIYPRVLVLAGIRQHVLDENFKAAFLACQTHQVDLNILHDYRPDLFMDKIDVFINEVKKVSRIDEFLSKLKEEDVSQTLYRDTLNRESVPTNNHGSEPNLVNGTNDRSSPQSKSAGKVNRICDAFLGILKTKPPQYLQNIMTAHVSKRPPDLSSALGLATSLRESDPSAAESAISHLCFLTDSNRLYDAALSLYDLEITLLVAQNSQRDPREYLPFLQSLHALSSFRRQYEIDNHLHNHAKALTSLHALNAHDEVEAYTIKHSLYITALDLYKYDQAHLVSTTRLYASHLAATSNSSLAGTLYESLGDYKAAYPQHALAHHWREALTCATLVPLDPPTLASLATSLAATCADESRDYRAAATIHADYLNDIPAAARLLCKGSYFAEASRLLALRPAPETAQIIPTGLSDKFSEILELLVDFTAQLSAQVPRIALLRAKKASDPLAFFGGDPNNADDSADIPDNISLAPTDATTAGGASLFTRYGSNASKFGGTVASNVSRRTSKTARREERKRARGKAGSVYEEEYLVASLGRLIMRVNGVQEEVGRLVLGLLRSGLEGRERTAVVDKRMGEVVGLCEEARKNVWGDEEGARKERETENENRGSRPSGADGVLWDSQIEMSLGKQGLDKAPEVHRWKRVEVFEL